MKQVPVAHIAGFIVASLIAVWSSEAANYKPIVFAPGYQHDKWNTEPDDHIREFRAFTASFDGEDDGNANGDSDDAADKWGIPEWVAYEIRKAPNNLGSAPKRPSPWIHDTALFNDGVCPDDSSYKHSGYSRGHMCMKSIAWRLGANADWNTHTTINAVPQLQGHNGGIWLHLEELTKQWADEYGKIWVICGPIFENGVPSKWIGDRDEKKVAVPDYFFKIVIRETDGGNGLDTMAFIQPHRKIAKVGQSYRHENYFRSIREIEDLTGINFLTSLDDSVEDAIEEATANQLWSTDGAPEPGAPDELEAVDELTDEALRAAIEDLKKALESYSSVSSTLLKVGEEGEDHAEALELAREATQEAYDFLAAFDRQEPVSEEDVAEGFQLKIVAVLPNPAGDDAIGESVTVRNTADTAVDLSHFRLEDDDNTSWQLAGVIQPGATMVFVTEEMAGSLKLSNNGDVVNLVRIADGRLIDSVTYGKARSGESFSF